MWLRNGARAPFRPPPRWISGAIRAAPDARVARAPNLTPSPSRHIVRGPVRAVPARDPNDRAGQPDPWDPLPSIAGSV
jgi:hypothetical protein